MPASLQPSPSDARPKRHAKPHPGRQARLRGRREGRPGLRRDAAGVSEVLGSILALATVTMILIIGFYSFSQNETRVRERVVALEAEAAAQRVAATAVDAAVFAEAHGDTATYRRSIDLPDSLEGSTYRVSLEASPARVRVVVPTFGTTATAPLFGADAAIGVDLCDTDLVGGRLTVRYDDTPVPGSPCVYLESAP